MQPSHITLLHTPRSTNLPTPNQHLSVLPIHTPNLPKLLEHSSAIALLDPANTLPHALSALDQQTSPTPTPTIIPLGPWNLFPKSRNTTHLLLQNINTLTKHTLPTLKITSNTHPGPLFATTLSISNTTPVPTRILLNGQPFQDQTANLILSSFHSTHPRIFSQKDLPSPRHFHVLWSQTTLPNNALSVARKIPFLGKRIAPSSSFVQTHAQHMTLSLNHPFSLDNTTHTPSSPTTLRVEPGPSITVLTP